MGVTARCYRRKTILTGSWPSQSIANAVYAAPQLCARLCARPASTPAGLSIRLFICPGEGVRKACRLDAGSFNFSVDEAVKECREVYSLGIPAMILFGLPDTRTRAPPRLLPTMALCSSPPGRLRPRSAGLLSWATFACASTWPRPLRHCEEVPARQASASTKSSTTPRWTFWRTPVAHAKAGIDIIAPSDMMDGRVAAIRTALDEAGFSNTPILSYAANLPAVFTAVSRSSDSAPQFGDRRLSDGRANVREAMREIELDMEEGADMIMVKPAMPYLDVIAAGAQRFDCRWPPIRYRASTP